MAQEQCKINGLQALSCYTVDSDFESEDDEDGNNTGEVVIKQEVINATYVTMIKEEVVDEEETEKQGGGEEFGFGEVVVKSEPLWEIDNEGQRDPQDYLQPQVIKTEIESSSSESESSSDDSDSDDSDAPPPVKENPTKNLELDENDTGPVKSKNELGSKDLPPVEDLEIRVGLSACKMIGVVSSIVDDLVVIESLPDMPALDLESVLFFKSATTGGLVDTVDLTAIGRVFDVIGPVTRPYYVVRFNNNDHVKSKGVVAGADIYYSPKSEHTSFVFLEQLMNMKISDASWKDDEEIPFELREFSDDEQEAEAKKKWKAAKKVVKGEPVIINEVIACKRPRNELSNQRQTQNNQSNHTRESRHNNGLYSQNNNPFYRQSRSYDPRNAGPIRWSGYNVGQQHPQPPSHPFSVPPPTLPHFYPSEPPPPGTSSLPPATAPPPTHNPSSTAIQGGGWQGYYNNQQAPPGSNPYQHVASRISQTNNQAQSQQYRGNAYGLWSAPPPSHK